MSFGCGNSQAQSPAARHHFPDWLKRRLPPGSKLKQTGDLLKDLNLNTVCEEARCPNRLECYHKGTATFLVLGKHCTRSCGFCSIAFSKNPPPPDPTEPLRVAESVHRLGLRHAVITMVARDDLPDGGASHLVAIVDACRRLNSNVTIELLTSDFNGNLEALDIVLQSNPEVFNHNLETVERLTPRVRHRATYRRSLELLRQSRQNSSGILKSGLMLGLGETSQEIEATLRDLAEVGCDIVTMGQYLQSDAKKLRVKQFVPPAEFDHWAEVGKNLGIPQMFCGPFVRSSYHAELLI
jgi:lipoic acid synthetase